MKASFMIFAVLSLALALSAGCMQQEPGENNTNQTCETGTCPAVPVTSFEECAHAGYPVQESYPRQCRTPDSEIFTENLSQLCQEAGGHWNECSNRCRLDNQGNPDAVCIQVCEPLCECGGIAGFSCPEGYSCKMPSGIADALGYCIPEESENATLTREQAYDYARNSTCAQEGNLTDNAFYNPNSRTWWIDLEPFTPAPLCNPACVVYENGSTEINWRCTGLVPPLNEEVIDNLTCSAPGGAIMSLRDALQRAESDECAETGSLTDRHFCNDVTGTWWIDLEPYSPKQGCNPACVVNVTTGAVEVNWRCTGYIPG
jgi:hypothetical protein